MQKGSHKGELSSIEAAKSPRHHIEHLNSHNKTIQTRTFLFISNVFIYSNESSNNEYDIVLCISVGPRELDVALYTNFCNLVCVCCGVVVVFTKNVMMICF